MNQPDDVITQFPTESRFTEHLLLLPGIMQVIVGTPNLRREILRQKYKSLESMPSSVGMCLQDNLYKANSDS